MVVIPRFERINYVIQEIYFILHIFYHDIILFLIAVILSGDPFRASRGSKRSKRVTPGVCEEYFSPVLCQIIAATITALLTIATPTTAISGATATTIGNGLLPGAATAALFGPAVARNGQKGSPHRSAGHPTGLWVILTSTTSARLLLRLFDLLMPLPLPLLLVVRYCYGYTEWAPARGGHCDPFRASKTSKRSKRVAAGLTSTALLLVPGYCCCDYGLTIATSIHVN